MNEAATEQDISRLFRVRRTVLELLSDRGYAVMNTVQDLLQPRETFAEEFRRHNFNREMLTILRQKRDDAGDQIYVFFPDEQRNKLLGVKPISEKAERMERDGVQSAIIILQTGLTAYAKSAVDKLSASDRCRMEVFLENELIVNITRHLLVPDHEVLSTDAKTQLLRRYKLKESQLPRIQKSDPIARYYGLTHGTVVKITRPSETAGRLTNAYFIELTTISKSLELLGFMNVARRHKNGRKVKESVAPVTMSTELPLLTAQHHIGSTKPLDRKRCIRRMSGRTR